jgi:hypothetical protein
LRGGAAPSIIEPMQDGPLDPARHAQLAEALARVFGPLDAAALADVESKLHWISLAGARRSSGRATGATTSTSS